MLRQRIDASTVLHTSAVGVVSTSWRHTTARAVADRVPDPQPHSHVLLHAAHRPDGRLLAIDSRSWLPHQRYFELAGLPQPLLDRWSSHHHQVQAAILNRLTESELDLRATIQEGGPAAADARERLELLLANGQLAPGEERLMRTITRADKVAVTTADLHAEWGRTARRIGSSTAASETKSHSPRSQTPSSSSVTRDRI